MRAVLYLRVSTANGQTTDNQRLELEAVAGRNTWQVVEIYEDAGISGAKGREKRPAFDRMLKAAVRREFDVIMAWSVDRLGVLAPRPGRVSLGHPCQGRRALPPPTRHRYDHALWQGDVPDDGRVRRVRACHGSRARARWAQARQGEGKKLGRPTISAAKELAVPEPMLQPGSASARSWRGIASARPSFSGSRPKSQAKRHRSTSEGQESRTVWVQVRIGGRIWMLFPAHVRPRTGADLVAAALRSEPTGISKRSMTTSP